MPAEGAVIAQKGGPLEQVGEFLSSMDYSPLWDDAQDLRRGHCVRVLPGAGRRIFHAAHLEARPGYLRYHLHHSHGAAADGLRLPSVVGRSGATRPSGASSRRSDSRSCSAGRATVLAAVVVAFPLMYRSARGAFESLDPNMLDAARTLGWSNGRIFLRLMLPLAWSSIASGTVLAFARALGEFGCTLFLAGNQLGSTRTIPIAIYFEWMNGNTEATWFWTIVLLVFSFLVILFINLWSRHTTRYRQKSSHEGRSPKPRRNGTRGGGRRRSAKGLREDSAGSADVLGEGVA